ncbi:class I SAM-dependent methyltransferase [Alloacidobacterium dinghuense]|uniref:S-adenosyl-L-methionine-dependent methyltransferase n=1 Tax=Alloacidobacterium dinghuense TaxID=2763107 RepID=A0A7G8BHM0_9BACT|nr:class I SAM-dependent methyltransferase [Alloacidobacterium dinghuense]QNI32040.1 class I SAM-dependent methyltransferase [Alloacidobacterium dinghuense]
MQEGNPSKTAFGVARRRAAHQILDQQPLVLTDPIAVPILGPQTAASIRAEAEKHNHPFSLAMRAFMVARSRYAEDQLRTAITTGVRQYVILGAGLDTFAYRNLNHELKVFEVDHPATQEWKRYLLAQAVIEVPPSLTFVPVDFEKHTLTDGLAQARFDFAKPAFFSWLGVTPYLTLEAFRATIHAIAAMPQGSGVTFEYTVERSLLSFREKMAFDVIAERVAKAGEPFQLFFSPDAMQQELSSAGFTRIEELTSDEINERYFRDRRDSLKLQGNVARLITAWR